MAPSLLRPQAIELSQSLQVLPPGQPLGDRGESIGLLVPDGVEAVELSLVLHRERRVRFRVGE